MITPSSLEATMYDQFYTGCLIHERFAARRMLTGHEQRESGWSLIESFRPRPGTENILVTAAAKSFRRCDSMVDAVRCRAEAPIQTPFHTPSCQKKPVFGLALAIKVEQACQAHYID